ncbi:hypothetical protein M9H77_09625 [Catharanthus roseus]|uniref:Uncharacterized protein n=1 Tax=Catharanthus roseus TaxID=4058 RepID=A0ACC0C1B8_CATRO|nr:hypothetical protein M9H77_09625 [Catharanthus roseus]
MDCAVSAQKLYNVLANMKKKRINFDESNVPSDIVVAHLTSIQLMRTWIYVLIKDTTYNMPLLEAIEMTPIGTNFNIATAFMRNEKDITYKHLYFALAASIGNEEDVNAHEPVVIITYWESDLILVINENCLNENTTSTPKPSLKFLALKELSLLPYRFHTGTVSRPRLTALAATIASSFLTGVLEEEEEDRCSNLLRPRKK